LSEQFLKRSLFAALDAIRGAIVTSHTHTHTPKCNDPVKTQGNCGLTMLIVSLLSLCRLRITIKLRSGTVDKMTGIFTKRIWQP